MAVTRDETLEFDLATANTFPRGIAFGDDKFWVVDLTEDKVFAYNSDGTRSSGDDFNFDSTITPQGITFANDKLYILSNTFSARKVWAYNTDGTRSADDDFDLPNTSLQGITFGNDKFYITQPNNRQVLVYSSTGTQLTDEGFNLDSESFAAEGITFVYNKLYVIDTQDEKAYVYGTDGTRYADEDFGTVDSNPRGITFNDNTFFVLGGEQNHVFAFSLDFTRVEKDFSASWGITERVQKDFSGLWDILNIETVSRDADSDFDLGSEVGNPRGISWDKDNEMFWVIDSTDDKVYAHTADGTRVSGSDFVLSVSTLYL